MQLITWAGHNKIIAGFIEAHHPQGSKYKISNVYREDRDSLAQMGCSEKVAVREDAHGRDFCQNVAIYIDFIRNDEGQYCDIETRDLYGITKIVPSMSIRGFENLQTVNGYTYGLQIANKYVQFFKKLSDFSSEFYSNYLIEKRSVLVAAIEKNVRHWVDTNLVAYAGRVNTKQIRFAYETAVPDMKPIVFSYTTRDGKKEDGRVFSDELGWVRVDWNYVAPAAEETLSLKDVPVEEEEKEERLLVPVSAPKTLRSGG